MLRSQAFLGHSRILLEFTGSPVLLRDEQKCCRFCLHLSSLALDILALSQSSASSRVECNQPLPTARFARLCSILQPPWNKQFELFHMDQRRKRKTFKVLLLVWKVCFMPVRTRVSTASGINQVRLDLHAFWER